MFDKIRTAGVTGNATNDKNSQGENPICSTRDEILQLSRPISPRATTAVPAKEIFIMIALDGHELSACIHDRLRAVHYWWPVNGRTWIEAFLYTHSLTTSTRLKSLGISIFNFSMTPDRKFRGFFNSR